MSTTPGDGRSSGTTEPLTLSREQYVLVARCIKQWLELRALYRHAGPPELSDGLLIQQLWLDIEHSELLYRMLVEGMEPLPEPPPGYDAMGHWTKDYSAAQKRTT